MEIHSSLKKRSESKSLLLLSDFHELLQERTTRSFIAEKYLLQKL